ncbi:MAG: toprim domain-containing protein [Clostridia bacterium]|nr:toprim domain-containing protein [Clostridia bacterium]
MRRYTPEQIDRANKTDLVAYLQSHGYELKREGRQFKLAEHDSLYIRGNQWIWFSQNKGGKTLSFLMEYEKRPFLEAMRELVGEPEELGENEARYPEAKPVEITAAKELKLPEPAPDNNAAFKYLKGRGIDARKVKKCIDEGTIYQTNMFWQQNENGEYEAKQCPPAVVFVGKDEDGVARYACTRSVTGDGKHDAPGSDKTYAFMIPDGNSKSVYVFESAIDALSHATMANYGKKHYSTHRISLGGLCPNALMHFLDTHPDVCFVNLALDNDAQGRTATENIKGMLEQRFGDELGDKYYIYDHPAAIGKDYNEELLYRQQQFRERKKAEPENER